jgi:hypothetical protein
MPSYSGLPEEKKTALVEFLAQLKGEPEEGAGRATRGSPEGGIP